MTRRWINCLALTASAAVSAASAFGLGLLQPGRKTAGEGIAEGISSIQGVPYGQVPESTAGANDERLGGLKTRLEQLGNDKLAAELMGLFRDKTPSEEECQKMLKDYDPGEELGRAQESLKVALHSLAGRAKTWLEQNPEPPPAHLEEGKPLEFEAGGQTFVWVKPEESVSSEGFWITKEEIRLDAEEKLKGDLTPNLPSPYTCRKPSSEEWKAAYKKAESLKLSGFEDGLGEVLNDETIIGINSDFPKSKDIRLEALGLEERLESTQKTESVKVREDRSTATEGGSRFGGTKENEQLKVIKEPIFATRLVVIPKSTE